MQIRAQVFNRKNEHRARVFTGPKETTISILPKQTGTGSSVNGGELLFLALATCYCNDIYREAAKRNIQINGVEVVVTGEFGKEGESAKNVEYSATVSSDATPEALRDLLEHTDKVAEIQNTLRAGTPVLLRHNQRVDET